jgi:hypothetical protein
VIDPRAVARKRISIDEMSRSSRDDVVAEADVAEQIRVGPCLREDGDKYSRTGNPQKDPNVLCRERSHRPTGQQRQYPSLALSKAIRSVSRLQICRGDFANGKSLRHADCRVISRNRRERREVAFFAITTLFD